MAKRKSVTQRGNDTRVTRNRGAVQRPSEMTKEEKADIHAEAMRRGEEIWDAEQQNMREGRDCQRFYVGGEGQWEAKARASRVADGRPVLTINLLPKFVRQMTGDLRKNPPSLKFLPAKGKASKETAEAFGGITRHIEQQSSAKDCYIIATENAAIASQGFFRVVTEYSSDDGFEQDIRIRPIRDPFGAALDPYATLPDKSDARYGFVFEFISVEDFEAAWPGHSASEVPMPDEGRFPWRRGNSIRIAEYWKRKPVKKTLILLDDGAVVEDEADIPEGRTETNRREVEAYEVVMYRVSGAAVLSGPHAFPSKYIPICMVVGEEVTIDNVTTRKGMVHDARDPQRVYNYSRTASVEAIAQQPKAPWVGTVAMFANRPEWKTAGSKNHSYLAYNIDKNAPKSKPERAQPALASQGLDTQSIIASNDLEAATGIFKTSLGAPSNETSGVAIAQRQQEGDTTTFLYPDNLSRALSCLGRILADMIPRVIDTEREVRILKEDGSTEMLPVNVSQENQQQDAKGRAKPLYDLSAGEYDVVVSVGPSFASRRAEAASHMVELATGLPIVGQAAPDLIVENMDFPGADAIAKRIKGVIGIGEDGEPIQQEQQQDPTQAAGALKDAADADLKEAQANKTRLESAGLAQQITMMGGQIEALMQLVQGLQAQQQPGAGDMPPMGAPPPEAPPMMPVPAPNGDELPMVDVEAL